MGDLQRLRPCQALDPDAVGGKDLSYCRQPDPSKESFGWGVSKTQVQIPDRPLSKRVTLGEVTQPL